MGELLAAVMPLILVLTFIAAWITHVVVCIGTSSWVLLAIGALVFPVGIVHGFAVWFGVL